MHVLWGWFQKELFGSDPVSLYMIHLIYTNLTGGALRSVDSDDKEDR